MGNKARILFVDDEVRIVSLLKMIFRTTYEVFTATSGSEALEIVKVQHIDVIVSDQRMPEMLGIDLLTQVRIHSPKTMRLLLTGYSDLAAIIGAVNEGEVYRFLNKPWDAKEMKEVIGEAAKIALSLADVPVSLEPIEQAANDSVQDKKDTLLVLQGNEEDRIELLKMFRQDYHVLGAKSVQEAIKILERHDVGVIVAEPCVGNEETGPFLRSLKKYYPMITTVVITNSADSNLIVKLINEAQIYRFALKPLRENVFRLAVSGAMKEHRRFCAIPELTARTQVARSAEPESESDQITLTTAIFNSISRLRARFSIFR